MLLIIPGEELGEPHVPITSPFVVGRGVGCQLCIDREGVEEEHLRIEDGALVALADCIVGEVPLARGARRLAVAGHEILLGTARLRLADDPVATPSVPTHVLALRAVQRTRPHARILVVEGAAAGAALVLVSGAAPAVVGRSAGADLVLDDGTVSRRHLRVAGRQRDVVVEDLGSAHGSWLGSARLAPHRPAVWAPGTMLRLGTTTVLCVEPALEIEDVLPPERVTSEGDDARHEARRGASVDAELAVEGGAEEPAATPHGPPAEAPSVSILAETGPERTAEAAPERTAPEPHFPVVDVIVVTVAIAASLVAIAGLVWILST